MVLHWKDLSTVPYERYRDNHLALIQAKSPRLLTPIKLDQRESRSYHAGLVLKQEKVPWIDFGVVQGIPGMF